MGFQQGLSGLSISSKSLDAISNNVSNAGTVGFKQSTAQFSDVFSASLSAGSSAQVGVGASVEKMAQLFNQGNVTSSNNTLDMAISGQGFFRMSNNGEITYSRNGQFQTDKNGYIVNSSGLRLTGKLADANGQLTGATGEIKMNYSDAKPQASTGAGYVVNLDARSSTPSALTKPMVTGSAAASLTVGASPANVLSITVDGGTATTVTVAPGTYADSGALVTAIQTAIDQTTLKGRVAVSTDSAGVLSFNSLRTGRLADIKVAGAAATALNVPSTTATATNAAFSITNPSSYSSTTSQTVYDSLGNPHTQTLYFVKTAQPNTWDLYTSLDGGYPPEINPTTGVHTPLTVNFNANGVLLTPQSYNVSYPISSGAVTTLDFKVDLTDSTQYGSSFGVNLLKQDGYATGKLTGVQVGADGTIKGNFSNGQTRVMGQVWLTNFQNPNGLQAVGGNQWAATNASGAEQPNAPGTSNLGVVQSMAIEESNVDLTSELVSMITQQRAYQANAQSIKTQDQVLQTLVNLR